MATMAEIEQAAKEFSEAHAVLSGVCVQLQAELAAAKNKHLEALKKAVAVAKTKHSAVATLVQASPTLFKKPRSVVVHGVKLGYEKAPGKVVIENVLKTIKAIKKLFPEQAKVLIKTTEKPVKKALSALSADDLKKLSVDVTKSGDVVFVVHAAAEVDKLVAAFLTDENQTAEAANDEDEAAA
jgi:hypothetical protein